jgi:ATP-dependent protease HslVU (ClpYQ) ATPase subunit
LLEKLLEEISFLGSELSEKKQVIDAEYVSAKLDGLVENRDLRQYIL